MNTETPGGELPDPDPLEPTGRQPSTRARVWILTWSIIGVIVCLILVSSWMAGGESEGEAASGQEQPAGTNEGTGADEP